MARGFFSMQKEKKYPKMKFFRKKTSKLGVFLILEHLFYLSIIFESQLPFREYTADLSAALTGTQKKLRQWPLRLLLHQSAQVSGTVFSTALSGKKGG